MNADIESGEHEQPRDAQGLDESAVHGIVVEEPLEIENIELGERRSAALEGLGWETVPTLDDTLDTVLDEPDILGAAAQPGEPPAAEAQLAQLEEEQLHLAAELARIRADAAARERRLEAQLAEARGIIAEREADISEQIAQIASLTLECSGLRARLQGADEPAAAAAAPGPRAQAGADELVARLKERLEERGRAIAVARGEIEALSHECTRLRQRLGELPPAPVTPADEGWHFGRHVLELLRRVPRHAAEDAASAAFAGEPGTEVPTVAVDPPSAPAAGARQEKAPSPPSRPAAGTRAAAAPRRYLIALDDDRDDVVELRRERLYVGRGAEADIRLGDATVSRLHAVLSLEGAAAVVEDASSTNGVFVNHHRVRRALLRDGDTVTFGTVKFQYRIGPPPGR